MLTEDLVVDIIELIEAAKQQGKTPDQITGLIGLTLITNKDLALTAGLVNDYNAGYEESRDPAASMGLALVNLSYKVNTFCQEILDVSTLYNVVLSIEAVFHKLLTELKARAHDGISLNFIDETGEWQLQLQLLFAAPATNLNARPVFLVNNRSSCNH
jgi:hypothetical protein